MVSKSIFGDRSGGYVVANDRSIKRVGIYEKHRHVLASCRYWRQIR